MLPSFQSINPFNIPLQRKQQMFKEFFIVFLILFGIDYFFIKYFLGPIFGDLGAQRPPKWSSFRSHFVNFLVIQRKSEN